MIVKQQDETPPALPESEMCFLLIDTARLFYQALDGSIVDNRQGLTPGTLRALGAVIRYRGMGLNRIADRMDLEPMSLIVHINRLATLGLVERREDPKDKRKKPLYPTAKAFEVMRDLDPHFDNLYRAMTQDIQADEMARLAAVLTKMRANMTTDPGITAPFTLLPAEPNACSSAQS
ncbi:MarR family winged helix-turn-helix transcriptional regulator [Aureimonas ureilytica]|uniref:MarR family winged helix-turn-helix transcriptional regulator n=1 Tax=Aureimonas ureilytica TaxID=401562 RepID=UPI000AD95A28|nr:MarR family winged helix-turn-helix transcriptional regulator [Aureimonas ureilytica]